MFTDIIIQELIKLKNKGLQTSSVFFCLISYVKNNNSNYCDTPFAHYMGTVMRDSPPTIKLNFTVLQPQYVLSIINIIII